MKKYINQMDMKQANAADLFALIRKYRQLTRKEIETKTGFSWGAVSEITASLLEQNYIREFKAEKTSGAGRTPSYLEVNTANHFVLGIDINLSGLKAVLINLKNEVLATHFAKVTSTDKDSFLDEIYTFLEESLEFASGKDVIAIGIAMQGIVDPVHGISVSLPQCRNWSEVPLAELLYSRFQIPVFLEHDPDCILYAVSTEAVYRDALLLRVDNGIGMSVLSEGKILNKPGMFEIGHTISVLGGAPCSCGKRGCLEVYASTEGMSRLAGTDFDTLVQKARAGHPESIGLFHDMAGHLALALSNAAHLLHMTKVFLCGNMWLYKDLFYGTFLEQIQLTDAPSSLAFSFVDVENAATGAALIAAERVLKHLKF